MSGYHKCLGENCRKWITYRFAICAACEQTYGNKATGWPDWLRFLWNDIQRDRRRNKRIMKHEVTFVDLEEEEDDGG